MNMFCYSKIIFSEPNQFVHLLNCSKGSVSKGISRKNTMLLITTKSDEVKQSREALIHKERTGAEREESLSGYESNFTQSFLLVYISFFKLNYFLL